MIKNNITDIKLPPQQICLQRLLRVHCPDCYNLAGILSSFHLASLLQLPVEFLVLWMKTKNSLLRAHWSTLCTVPSPVHIVYSIDSTAHGVTFVLLTSCSCQTVARTSEVRASEGFSQKKKASTKHFLWRELFISHIPRIFNEIVFLII